MSQNRELPTGVEWINMKCSAVLALLFGTWHAYADITVGGVTGLAGEVSQAQDCYRVSFPDPRDTQFFITACLGSTIATQLFTTVSGSVIDPNQISTWLGQNRLDLWVIQNVVGIAPMDEPDATLMATRILQNIEGNHPTDGGDPRSAWVYYLPYPTLREKCLANGELRFHGALVFYFGYDSGSNAWVTSRIGSAVNCRKT
jgi:hypothetical protein